MSQRFGVERRSRGAREELRRAGGWLLVALLTGVAGCLGETPRFCQSWLSGPESEQQDLVGDAVRDWLEASRGSRPSNVNFIKCVGREVLARDGAITEACELYGDLEAGVVVGTLVSSGVRSCLDPARLREGSD